MATRQADAPLQRSRLSPLDGRTLARLAGARSSGSPATQPGRCCLRGLSDAAGLRRDVAPVLAPDDPLAMHTTDRFASPSLGAPGRH